MKVDSAIVTFVTFVSHANQALDNCFIIPPRGFNPSYPDFINIQYTRDAEMHLLRQLASPFICETRYFCLICNTPANISVLLAITGPRSQLKEGGSP